MNKVKNKKRPAAKLDDGTLSYSVIRKNFPVGAEVYPINLSRPLPEELGTVVGEPILYRNDWHIPIKWNNDEPNHLVLVQAEDLELWENWKKKVIDTPNKDLHEAFAEAYKWKGRRVYLKTNPDKIGMAINEPIKLDEIDERQPNTWGEYWIPVLWDEDIEPVIVNLDSIKLFQEKRCSECGRTMEPK